MEDKSFKIFLGSVVLFWSVIVLAQVWLFPQWDKELILGLIVISGICVYKTKQIKDKKAKV